MSSARRVAVAALGIALAMMLDNDVVAVSPSTTHRVLRAAGRLDRWNHKPSMKGTGFVQPLYAHEHWHIDISYINLAGTFYYLCSILDGASRAIVHHELRPSMKESDIECILQRGREEFPGSKPRIISDNGPQFLAEGFQGVHSRGRHDSRPHVPLLSTIERQGRTLAQDPEARRHSSPRTLERATGLVARFVEHYNSVRLHSAIGYIAPNDFLSDLSAQIWSDRDAKLEAAREARRARRAEQRGAAA